MSQSHAFHGRSRSSLHVCGYARNILRTLALVVLLNCIPLTLAVDPPPQQVATLDTAEFLPNQRDPCSTTIAFSSDTTIEVIACPTLRRDTTCPSAVFRWENAVLEHIVQTSKSDTGGRSSSADGKRILLDYNDRAVPRFQHLFDDVRAVTTFGMIYPEGVNREVIRVVDSATRKSCRNWHRVFPMTGTRGSLQRSRLPVNWWRSKWKTVFLFTGFLRCGERQE